MKTIKNSINAIWGSCILFVTACPVMGQVGQTPKLTPDKYGLWSNLESAALSEKANWVSYKVAYESGNDTLFVKNANSSKAIAFPKGYNGLFNKEEQFACITDNNTFQLLNLKTNQIQKMEEVSEYYYLNHGKQLLFIRNQNENTFLEIRDKDLNVLKVIPSVNNYVVNPDKTALVYQTSNKTNSNKVFYLSLEKGLRPVKVVESKEDSFQNFVWHHQGKAFAFVNQLKIPDRSFSDKLFYYDIPTKKQYVFELDKTADWPKDMIIQSSITECLRISDDRTAVFFTIKKKPNGNNQPENNEVQVWNAADKDLFEFKKRHGDEASQNRLAVWYPHTGKYNSIGNEKEPSAIVLPNQKVAILMDPGAHKPEAKYTPDADYYLLDIPSGKKTSFIKKGPGGWRNMEFSPGGSYIVYAKDTVWWLYNLSNKTHQNLSKNVATDFFDQDNDKPETSQPYGVAGWAKDGKELYLYDKYDIWQITLQDNSAKRITKGKESDIIFRVNKQSIENVNSSSFSKPVMTINLEKEIIVDAVASDFSKSGYFTFENDKGLRSMVFEDRKIDNVIKAEKQEAFLHVQQSYSEPPSITLYDKNKGQSKTIFKSNPQHQLYNSGKSEIVEYKNAKGKSLKGVLFYPFNYNPDKQYPMIVQIYERQLHALHSFTNPSLFSSDGFNKTNFTSQEYFVLYPDIVYEIGNPGFSAVDCVVAATKSAMTKAPVNPDKIGLMGHSFGGYETNFIITQTDIFAAAISGCGISDLTSFYLSVGWSYAKDNSWPFEEQQMRMGKSFFENTMGYRNNSPIYHAEKIKTPLLSWTGGSDTQVNSFQSFEWYSALRKLRKENVFIVYPKEGHALINEENQKDLTVKAMEWFDYYLKEGEKKEWMVLK